MNDGPPSWMDDAPPVDPGAYGQPAGGQRGSQRNGGRVAAPKMTPEQIAAAAEDFYAWLLHKDTAAQLRMMLPDHVDLDVFTSTCKTAVLNRPHLLREDLRQSLLVAIMKAAAQGLKPDGKEGALVVRYDSEAHGYAAVWQPMVWGVAKLGRETGAIKQIRAVIVFHGEAFRIIQGEEDRIDHEVDPDIVDEAYGALNAGLDEHKNPKANPAEFFKRVRASYCFITGTDGTVTRRYMTKQRLISLWEASKAANGPWNSRWIDEMILKGVILFTSKWINLDTTSAAAKRFQSALMTDMEIDFDRQGLIGRTAPEDHAPVQQQAMLPPPTDKLGSLEDVIMGAGKIREKVSVHPGRGSSPSQSTAPGATGDGAGRVSSPGLSQQEQQQPAGDAGDAGPAQNGRPVVEQQVRQPTGETPDDRPWIDKVTDALLIDNGVGQRWMGRLEKALLTCPSLDDLAALRAIPSVRNNAANAPRPEIRSHIAAGFADAANRLAEAAIPDEEVAGDGEDDSWPGPKTGEAA